MKALTLIQPWATLIAIGAKKIETRGWKTIYRGPLAIHASKGWSKEVVRRALFTEPFKTLLNNAGYTLYSLLPRGVIIATCELVSVKEILPAHTFRRMLGWQWTGPDGVEYCYELDDQERALGNYSPGRYAWMLHNVQPLPEPIAAIGKQGVWEAEVTL